MTRDWERALLPDTGSIADAIRVLETNTAHICVVVDAGGRLRGTITDGDVRRGLLRSLPLTTPATEIMKAEPLTGHPKDGRYKLLDILRGAQIRQLPLVDDEGTVLGVATVDELAGGKSRPNWVVLMAGGMGLRLRPLTAEMPKPMLKIGTKPLLESTLERFLLQDFRRFYISVNYLADKVKEHFGDGHKWNCEIRYLEEPEQLGTAGALGLIPEPPVDPIIVMNGDVLTNVNFGHLLDFHSEHRAAATMCVRQYDFQVPYGVISLEETRIRGVTEKPVQSFFVNAGIYAIEPHLLQMIPRDGQCFHMTHLFEKTIAANLGAVAFPIREYWLDIGQIDDLTRANGDYPATFE